MSTPQGFELDPIRDTQDDLPLLAEKPTPAKAITAGVMALAGLLITALADAGITATEWVTIVSGTILAVAGVYVVSNKPGAFTS